MYSKVCEPLVQLKEHNVWHQQTWIQILAPSYFSGVILSELLNLPESSLPHLQNGDNVL